MAQFKPFVLNVQAPGQRPVARYPQQFSTGIDGVAFTASDVPDFAKTCRNISGFIMFLIIAVALAVVCSQIEGQFSFWTNAKSMHYTISGTLASKSWSAVLPGSPYYNADVAARNLIYAAENLIYAADPLAENQFQFQLAIGGLLSNISPYACVTAVLLIYFLRTMDFVLFAAETHKAKDFWEEGWFTKYKFFSMFSLFVLGLYAVLNMWYDTDVNWGKVTAGVEFSYKQSWGSFATGGVLILLYIFQIYLKESSKPTKADAATAQRAYDKLQICNDYATEYSITSYLLISMLLGMSRSVVLETEAQLSF
jgi:hypothetical protein